MGHLDIRRPHPAGGHLSGHDRRLVLLHRQCPRLSQRLPDRCRHHSRGDGHRLGQLRRRHGPLPEDLGEIRLSGPDRSGRRRHPPGGRHRSGIGPDSRQLHHCLRRRSGRRGSKRSARLGLNPLSDCRIRRAAHVQQPFRIFCRPDHHHPGHQNPPRLCGRGRRGGDNLRSAVLHPGVRRVLRPLRHLHLPLGSAAEHLGRHLPVRYDLPQALRFGRSSEPSSRFPLLVLARRQPPSHHRLAGRNSRRLPVRDGPGLQGRGLVLGTPGRQFPGQERPGMAGIPPPGRDSLRHFAPPLQEFRGCEGQEP